MIITDKKLIPYITITRVSGIVHQKYYKLHNKYEPNFTNRTFINRFAYDVFVDGESVVGKNDDTGWSVTNVKTYINDVSKPNSVTTVDKINFIFDVNVNFNSSVSVKIEADLVYKINGVVKQTIKKTLVDEVTCELVYEEIRPLKISTSVEVLGGVDAISLFSLPNGRFSKIAAEGVYRGNNVKKDCVYYMGIGESDDVIKSKLPNNFSINYKDFITVGNTIDVSTLKRNNEINCIIKPFTDELDILLKRSYQSIFDANKDRVSETDIVKYNNQSLSVSPRRGAVFNNINISFNSNIPYIMYSVGFDIQVTNATDLEGNLMVSFRGSDGSVGTRIGYNDVFVTKTKNVYNKKYRVEIPILITPTSGVVNYIKNYSNNFSFYIWQESNNIIDVEISNVKSYIVKTDISVIATAMDNFARKNNVVNTDGIYYITKSNLNLFTPSFEYGVAIKTFDPNNPYIKVDRLELDKAINYHIVPWIDSKETGLCFETINDVPLTNYFDISWYTVVNGVKSLRHNNLVDIYKTTDYGKEVVCELIPYYNNN